MNKTKVFIPIVITAFLSSIFQRLLWAYSLRQRPYMERAGVDRVVYTPTHPEWEGIMRDMIDGVRRKVHSLIDGYNKIVLVYFSQEQKEALGVLNQIHSNAKDTNSLLYLIDIYSILERGMSWIEEQDLSKEEDKVRVYNMINDLQTKIDSKKNHEVFTIEPYEVIGVVQIGELNILVAIRKELLDDEFINQIKDSIPETLMLLSSPEFLNDIVSFPYIYIRVRSELAQAKGQASPRYPWFIDILSDLFTSTPRPSLGLMLTILHEIAHLKFSRNYPEPKSIFSSSDEHNSESMDILSEMFAIAYSTNIVLQIIQYRAISPSESFREELVNEFNSIKLKASLKPLEFGNRKDLTPDGSALFKEIEDMMGVIWRKLASLTNPPRPEVRTATLEKDNTQFSI